MAWATARRAFRSSKGARVVFSSTVSSSVSRSRSLKNWIAPVPASSDAARTCAADASTAASEVPDDTDASRLVGSSTKSMIGHPQGASGAAGVVATALALSEGLLPPTINVAHQDPDCDLDVIPNAARRWAPEAALCNCLGFGSKNSALVLGQP